MPRPFGRPIHTGLGLTRGMRLVLALLLAAIPAFFIGSLTESSYPTLSVRPFFGASAAVFAVFYAGATAIWLLKRPSPRPPGAGRFRLFMVRFLLLLLLSVPAGLLSALLYGPALTLLNGMISPGSPEIEPAMAVPQKGECELHLLYRTPGTTWKVPHARLMPAESCPWTLAKLTLRRGCLGAVWVEKIEYEYLR
jgi:hypothetical protein